MIVVVGSRVRLIVIGRTRMTMFLLRRVRRLIVVLLRRLLRRVLVVLQVIRWKRLLIKVLKATANAKTKSRNWSCFSVPGVVSSRLPVYVEAALSDWAAVTADNDATT